MTPAASPDFVPVRAGDASSRSVAPAHESFVVLFSAAVQPGQGLVGGARGRS